jgi:50S ribosomal subunit-associated GTPase HflX
VAQRQKNSTTRLAKAEARLKQLNTKGGHSKGAKKVEAQIKHVQNRQTKIKNRLTKLQSKCAATSGSATTTTSGSAGA